MKATGQTASPVCLLFLVVLAGYKAHQERKIEPCLSPLDIFSVSSNNTASWNDGLKEHFVYTVIQPNSSRS